VGTISATLVNVRPPSVETAIHSAWYLHVPRIPHAVSPAFAIPAITW
jgi:hypothetical protein